VELLDRDALRTADTNLIAFPLPPSWGVDLYLKDESTHPTGSLKHRLARSLFLHGLCNGWIVRGRHVVEASSGSTAVSEAYFARMLGVPFTAVVPAGTSPEKIALIEHFGGACHFVADGTAIYEEAEALTERVDGHFLDQFTYAERATDWRGNNNIAESIFRQMSLERFAVPRWVVVGAGTGGTSATIGRYVRYRCLETEMCLADPEGSVFADYVASGDRSLRSSRPSRIEGIGRPRVEASFVREVIDRVERVSDQQSLAAMRLTSDVLGRRVGGSTGTNLWAALLLAQEMVAREERGSIVTLLCDGGERYRHSYYDDAWLAAQGLDLADATAELRRVLGGRCDA
jgi:cysteine synthase A